MLTLHSILRDGYLEVAHRSDKMDPSVLQPPLMALGELEALVAWARAEAMRHYLSCRDQLAASVLSDAEQQLSNAHQWLGDACRALDQADMERAA